MKGDLLYDRSLNDKNILNASHEGKRAYTKEWIPNGMEKEVIDTITLSKNENIWRYRNDITSDMNTMYKSVMV